MLILKLLTRKNKYFISLFILFNLIIFNCASIAIAGNKTDNQKADSNHGLPIYRRDGGSRSDSGNCVADTKNENLVALIPNHSIGISTSDSPQLFFYVPKVNQPKTLEFVLRNEEDELIYEAFMTTSGNGIIGVEIPADLQSNKLETEQNYRWYLSMICNSQQRSRDLVVEGWMRQEKADLAIEPQLNATEAIAQSQIYYNRGFWFDALATLASQHSNISKPMVEAKWTELLESVGLKELASAPLVEAQIIKTSANPQQ